MNHCYPSASGMQAAFDRDTPHLLAFGPCCQRQNPLLRLVVTVNVKIKTDGSNLVVDFLRSAVVLRPAVEAQL